MKKKNGIVKSDKLYKAGMITAVSGLGLMALCTVGLFGDLIASMAVGTKKSDFIDEATSVPAYQEYFLEEKGKLDDALESGELSSKEYRLEFSKLENESKENFVAEHGTEEQKAELEEFKGKERVMDTVCDAFATSAVSGCVATLIAVPVAKIGENKMKKEEEKETAGEADDSEKE